MDIATQIRREARRRGVTTYRLSKDSGVPVSAVQKWWHGGGLRCDTAEKLARVLDLTIELRPARRRKRKA